MQEMKRPTRSRWEERGIAGHGETYRHDIDIGGVCIGFGFRQGKKGNKKSLTFV
jgi:hypothetical protein